MAVRPALTDPGRSACRAVHASAAPLAGGRLRRCEQSGGGRDTCGPTLIRDEVADWLLAGPGVSPVISHIAKGGSPSRTALRSFEHIRPDCRC